jgi:hypothetical protein
MADNSNGRARSHDREIVARDRLTPRSDED